MAFQREKQHISASDLLQAIADREDIQLTHCTITGVLDINRLFEPAEKFNVEKLLIRQKEDCKILTLPQSLVFDNCTFEENTVFAAPWSEPDSVSVEFEKDVIFNSSVFKGQARFRNSVFGGIASFDGCSFEGVVTFKNTFIQKDAKFRTTIFKGYSLFGSAVFGASARFTNTHFVKGANFSDVKFMGQTDFSGVYASSRAVPSCDSVFFANKRYGNDESFWRFVKQSASEAGYYQLAGQCFYNERCASLWRKFYGLGYESLSLPKKLGRLILSVRLLPELILGRLLFGYGERPIRVLTAAALVIFVCAFFYSQPGSIVHRDGLVQPSFLQGLYFSTITFTTLGYGDLYPSAEGFYRQLAMTEAITGVLLMALFVVCLAKKFSRS